MSWSRRGEIRGQQKIVCRVKRVSNPLYISFLHSGIIKDAIRNKKKEEL